MEEEWRAIVIEKNGVLYDYTGLYEVSNLGNVRSLAKIDSRGHARKEKILKLGEYSDGYKYINLHKNGKVKTFQVHRLVATAFIPNHDNLPVVNHRDENPSNNCVENLEWCTYKYNSNYGTCQKRRSEKMKGKFKGKPLSEEHKRKISNGKIKHKVLCIETNMIFNGLVEASKWCNSHSESILRCCQGKQKTACGYHWKFVD